MDTVANDTLGNPNHHEQESRPAWGGSLLSSKQLYHYKKKRVRGRGKRRGQNCQHQSQNANLNSHKEHRHLVFWKSSYLIDLRQF